MAAGATAVAAGGLGGVWLTGPSHATTTVLAATRALPAGATVEASDLTAVAVSLPAGVATVPTDQRDALVGKVARADLAAGSMLAPGAIGDPVTPQTGQSMLVLALPASRMPASGLRAGQHLVLVATTDTGLSTPDAASAPSTHDAEASSDTPASDSATSDSAAPWVATADAVVVRVGTAEPGGPTPVDVAVHAADGPLWAGLAAAGRVTVLVQPQGQVQR